MGVLDMEDEKLKKILMDDSDFRPLTKKDVIAIRKQFLTEGIKHYYSFRIVESGGKICKKSNVK